MNRSGAIALGAGVVLAAAAGTGAMMLGDTYEVAWETIDAGGGESEGGGYEVGITFGQLDGGQNAILTGASGGDAYELEGGFWPGPDAAGLIPADFVPDSCDNLFNCYANGVLNVLLLGDGDIDVSQVDLTSLSLVRADGEGDSVAVNSQYGPVAEYIDLGAPGDCTSAPDGMDDLLVPFRTSDMLDALALHDLGIGSDFMLRIYGNYVDGTPFRTSGMLQVAEPCAVPSRFLTITARNMTGTVLNDAWVRVTPSDNTSDGGGFGTFGRCFAGSEQVTITAPVEFNGLALTAWRIGNETYPVNIDPLGRTGRDLAEYTNEITVDIELIRWVDAIYEETTAPSGALD